MRSYSLLLLACLAHLTAHVAAAVQQRPLAVQLSGRRGNSRALQAAAEPQVRLHSSIGSRPNGAAFGSSRRLQQRDGASSDAVATPTALAGLGGTNTEGEDISGGGAAAAAGSGTAAKVRTRCLCAYLT